MLSAHDALRAFHITPQNSGDKVNERASGFLLGDVSGQILHPC